MTRFTHIGGIDVIGSFAGANAAIMTSNATGGGDFIVIQRCNKRQPRGRRDAVAHIAVVTGRWVRGWLALCQGFVMTGDAAAQYLVVIYRCNEWQPGACRRR